MHGYSERESLRLVDQAVTLTQLLHSDTVYPPGASVLEAGCGVGAQTVALVGNSPGARFTSVDLSAESLAAARARVAALGTGSVSFQQADLFHLPFPAESFDHVFVCFVLEHLAQPLEALRRLRRVLKPGGSLTVIEGDHGSVYFHPESLPARRAIGCLVDLQARLGGNALIGRQLYPLVAAAGFRETRVSPRQVYVDSSRPEWVEGFTRNTFTAMVEGVRDAALRAGLIDEPAWQEGVAGLHRTTQADGTFCYTFFKALAVK